jgi:hypothetical protein
MIRLVKVINMGHMQSTIFTMELRRSIRLMSIEAAAAAGG